MGGAGLERASTDHFLYSFEVSSTKGSKDCGQGQWKKEGQENFLRWKK